MDSKYKNILITGGAGFIGSNFVKHIYKKYPEYRLFNLDLLTYAGNPENLQQIDELELKKTKKDERYHFVQGDICDEKLVDKLFSENNFDAVVHFAAESHVDRSIFNVLHFVRTNIEGTRVLVEAARKYNLSRFVHVSTDEVYGSIAEGFANEDAPLRPSNPYSASKAGADLLIQSYISTHTFPAFIVRGSNNYGPNQYPEKLIPLAITNLVEGKKIPVHGSGKHKRSWLHTEDFCSAIDTVLHSEKNSGVYNVSGEEKTNMEVLETIAGILNKDLSASLSYVNDRPAADLRYAPDSGKLQEELNWQRLHSFDEAIIDTINWYLENQDWWKNIHLKKGYLEHMERQSNGKWC